MNVELAARPRSRCLVVLEVTPYQERADTDYRRELRAAAGRAVLAQGSASGDDRVASPTLTDTRSDPACLIVNSSGLYYTTKRADVHVRGTNVKLGV